MSEIMEGKAWRDYIHKRLFEKNKNFLGIVCGATGTGKSYSSLRWGEIIDKDFNIDQVVFSLEELMALIDSGILHKGSYVLVDEMGVAMGSRTWYSVQNRLFSYLLQTFRAENYCCMFTVPALGFIDKQARALLHGYFETRGIDKSSMTCKLKAQIMQYNPKMDKTYYKMLRRQVINKHGYKVTIPIDYIPIKLPDKNLIKQYEDKKKEFRKKLKTSIVTTLDKKAKEDEGKPKKPLDDKEQQLFDILKAGKTMKDAVPIMNRPIVPLYRMRKRIIKKGYVFT